MLLDYSVLNALSLAGPNGVLVKHLKSFTMSTPMRVCYLKSFNMYFYNEKYGYFKWNQMYKVGSNVNIYSKHWGRSQHLISLFTSFSTCMMGLPSRYILLLSVIIKYILLSHRNIEYCLLACWSCIHAYISFPFNQGSIK